MGTPILKKQTSTMTDVSAVATVLRTNGNVGSVASPPSVTHSDQLYNILEDSAIDNGFCIKAYKYNAGAAQAAANTGIDATVYLDVAATPGAATDYPVTTSGNFDRDTEGLIYTKFVLTSGTSGSSETAGCYFNTDVLTGVNSASLEVEVTPVASCDNAADVKPYATFYQWADIGSGGLGDYFDITYTDLSEAAVGADFQQFSVWDETKAVTNRVVRSSQEIVSAAEGLSGDPEWAANDSVWNLYVQDTTSVGGVSDVVPAVAADAWTFTNRFQALCNENAAGRTEVAFSVAAVAAVAAALF